MLEAEPVEGSLDVAGHLPVDARMADENRRHCAGRQPFKASLPAG
jgi:hypothetical protein